MQYLNGCSSTRPDLGLLVDASGSRGNVREQQQQLQQLQQQLFGGRPTEDSRRRRYALLALDSIVVLMTPYIEPKRMLRNNRLQQQLS